MLKQISNLGKVLDKKAQKEIRGGNLAKRFLGIEVGEIICTHDPTVCPAGQECTYVDIGLFTCQ